MNKQVYALITDGVKLVVYGDTLPHLDAGPSPANQANAITKLVKMLFPLGEFEEWRLIHSGDLSLFLFKIVGNLSGKLPNPEFRIAKVGSISLTPESLEDAVFGYLRSQAPIILKAGDEEVEVKAATMWADLARHQSIARRRKAERWDDQIEYVAEAWNELKDKYYPTNENPSFTVTTKDADFLARTVNNADGIKIEVNEKLFLNLGALRQCLAHELVHWILYLEGEDVATHGETFQMIADEINMQEGENYVTEFANDTKWVSASTEDSAVDGPYVSIWSEKKHFLVRDVDGVWVVVPNGEQRNAGMKFPSKQAAIQYLKDNGFVKSAEASSEYPPVLSLGPREVCSKADFDKAREGTDTEMSLGTYQADEIWGYVSDGFLYYRGNLQYFKYPVKGVHSKGGGKVHKRDYD